MNSSNIQRGNQTKIAIIFWLLALTDIIGIAFQIPELHFFAKPLLVPALLLLLFVTKTVSPGKYLLIAGLFFSWFGDLFLLFEYKVNLFFIFGLGSFLTTHIFYIIYFLRVKSHQASLLKKQPVLAVLVPVYGVSLVWLLYPHLGDLTLPVIIYALVICSMLLCSLHIFYKVNQKAAWYFVAGAAFFVLSDSLLAVDKFYQSLPFAGVCIMLTYCAAQYFIVTGYTQQTQS